MSGGSGKQQNGCALNNDAKSFFVIIEIGLSALDKLRVSIDNTTTVKDLKCKIEFLSGVPSDLFELDHNGTILTESLSPLIVKSQAMEGLVLKMSIFPVWERFIATCLKPENSQVRARIRVKMHGVTKDERIFVACFVAARQANSCLLFGLLPSNKMITRTVRLSKRNLLHAAVMGGNRNCIANILMNGGGKLINMEDIYGQTPMNMAKTLNTGDIVDMLEAYKMVSLRGEGSTKDVNDDDSGYECIIFKSHNLHESKDSTEHDSEGDYELSSNEEENDAQESSSERDLNEYSSSNLTDSRHFLDGFAGHDKTPATATTNEVTGVIDVSTSEEQLLIAQREDDQGNRSNGCAYKKTDNESAINCVNINITSEIKFREEDEHVESKGEDFVRSKALEVSCLEKVDSRKDNDKANCTVIRKVEKGQFLDDRECINKDNEIASTKENEKEPPIWMSENNAIKINSRINENQREKDFMLRDNSLNNGCIDCITDDLENPIKSGSHSLNEEMIFNDQSREKPAVLNGDKHPRNVIDTGNPLGGDETKGAKTDGNLLLRRRKKGMPSLIVSRTSSGLSSSYETLDLLDSSGKKIDSVSGNSLDGVCLNPSDESQVCSPPIIKEPLIPKPPSSPIPMAKSRQPMRRRKFSTGSPTSGSPKSYSRSDMQSYMDEAWRRASDSDVNELSLQTPPRRPRSYSTPQPPDPRELSKLTPFSWNETYIPRTSYSESKSFKNPNISTISGSNRRQSVGAWARRTSVAMTFDEWLESKKEQQRRNSLAVQKDNERRLSLGNQPTGIKFSKNIDYEQWLAMKALAPERKASQDCATSCHVNERPREESARAVKTWLQKKDEEALEREQRLLDEAISRRTRDTKREGVLSQLIQKMENKKRSGSQSSS